jgi:hypothetical protein
MKFISSLELSRMLFEQEIQPALAQCFPGLPYAAATLGMCSEVLGLDDQVSMDHEWGPRVRIFLSEADQARVGKAIVPALQELLPTRFKGFSMMWRQPGVDVHDTTENTLYHVSTGTLAGVLSGYGIRQLPLAELDWLRISEQHLLEFTAGVVYHDDDGALTRARQALGQYPNPVLCFLLMNEWYTVNGDWFPIGRMGERGDDLGLRIQAAKVAQHLMHIAFLVSRRYRPYKKWFGTLFRELPVAAELEPVLAALLVERRWQAVEERICEAAGLLLAQQNALGLGPVVKLSPRRAEDGRHYLKLDIGAIGRQLAAGTGPALRHVMENQVFWLDERRLILGNDEVGKWPLLLQK